MATVKLSPATIKAQQTLSNKTGVVTFNGQGKISTVATNGKGTSINVGTGAYKSSKELAVAVARKQVEVKTSQKVQASLAGKKATYSANPNPPIQPSNKTPTEPKVLSKSTIDAQQKLADRFGIPTFNTNGGLSTVPIHGVFADNINVGLGAYKDVNSLADAIVSRYAQPTTPPATKSGSSGGFFDSLFGTNQPPQDTTTGQQSQYNNTGLPEVTLDNPNTPQNEYSLIGGSGEANKNNLSKEEKTSFIDSIFKDPVKLGLGVIALTVLLVAGGKKK